MPKGKCLEGCNQMSWTENNVSARYFGGERKKYYCNKNFDFEDSERCDYLCSMKSTKICVIGMGYVGLPLARLFSTQYPTIGFDVNPVRVEKSCRDTTIRSKCPTNCCRQP